MEQLVKRKGFLEVELKKLDSPLLQELWNIYECGQNLDDFSLVKKQHQDLNQQQDREDKSEVNEVLCLHL